MTSPEFPRTLLLTWQSPDGRYAGAEVLRKILGELPADRLRWAYLDATARAAPAGLPEHRGFELRHAHWRLRNTSLRYVWEQHAQAAPLARRIADWAEPLRPQLVWLLAEMGAVTIGRRLGRLLGIPVHATIHDAFEFGRFSLPRLYYPLYRRSVRRMLAAAGSFDAVSGSLAEHVRTEHGLGAACEGLVFPPSVSEAALAEGAVPEAAPEAGQVRRIGLCGSMRISAGSGPVFWACWRPCRMPLKSWRSSNVTRSSMRHCPTM